MLRSSIHHWPHSSWLHITQCHYTPSSRDLLSFCSSIVLHHYSISYMPSLYHKGFSIKKTWKSKWYNSHLYFIVVMLLCLEDIQYKNIIKITKEKIYWYSFRNLENKNFFIVFFFKNKIYITSFQNNYFIKYR